MYSGSETDLKIFYLKSLKTHNIHIVHITKAVSSSESWRRRRLWYYTYNAYYVYYMCNIYCDKLPVESDHDILHVYYKTYVMYYVTTCIQVPVESDLQEIIKEISIMQQCDSTFIVKYYGSYFKNTDLWVSHQPMIMSHRWLVIELK